MTKILLIGGTHGNEPTGISLAQKIINQKLKNIDGILANPKAIQKNVRFTETDLNRSFESIFPLSFEEKLAFELKPKLKNYDLIIDIHDTDDIGTTCAIVTNSPNQLQIQTCVALGLDKMVIMPPSGSLISQNPEKSISIEISQDQMDNFNTEEFYQKIIALGKTHLADSTDKTGSIRLFKYVNSVNAKTFKMIKKKFGEIKNFHKLTETQLQLLDLKKCNLDFYPVFYGCSAYKNNVFHLVFEIL
jgi:succinylglutamate desuccinylase